jgi:Histidine kinase-, DNA gyrase B-, and HSP90-like ATPase
MKVFNQNVLVSTVGNLLYFNLRSQYFSVYLSIFQFFLETHKELIMALRTFHFNPSLGGFGGESSSTSTSVSSDLSASDAFCQIIKELVDNAVDACLAVGNHNSSTKTSRKASGCNGKNKNERNKNKRVRVVIERFQGGSTYNSGEFDEDRRNEEGEILRVTVSDNGCGMHDIQKCVGAFQTSKAHAQHFSNEAKDGTGEHDQDFQKQNTNARKAIGRKKKICENPSKKKSATTKDGLLQEGQTAGRYGIGLTLCLLHAQRLVPNSCASIQSATSYQTHWTNLFCVVDPAHDAVRCILQHQTTTDYNSEMKNSPGNNIKSFQSESGTSISILVPVSATILFQLYFGFSYFWYL